MLGEVVGPTFGKLYIKQEVFIFLWHLQSSHWWMLFVHPDDFDPVTSRIKLLAQVTWMQPSPVCTTYDGEYKYVRMYPMHLYFGKHIVRHSREVSIHWRYFGFGGSSRSIATLDVLVEQTRFHMNILRKTSKNGYSPCNGGWNDWKKIRCTTGTSHCHSTHLIHARDSSYQCNINVYVYMIMTHDSFLMNNTMCISYLFVFP